MKNISVAIIALASNAVVFDVGASGFEYQTDLTPLYAVYNPVTTDNVYTTLLADAEKLVKNYGYVNNGFDGSNIAMILPNGEPGYPGVGLGSGTYEVKRFFKGPPQVEHFYTIHPADQAFVLDQGYVYEPIAAGRFFNQGFLGSVPIYRLNKFNPNTSDLVHEYTVSEARKNTLVSKGYTLDGVVGYGYVPDTQPSYPRIMKYIGSIYVMPGQTWDIRGSLYHSENWLCRGHVDVSVDGVHKGRYSNWSFGPLPWSFSSEWGCYANTDISVNGHHTVRAAFSGSRGTKRNDAGTGYFSATVLGPGIYSETRQW